MKQLQEIYSVMRALLEITDIEWVTTFEKGRIIMTHDKFGEFTFSNIYEVKDFMHKNFSVIGHNLYYNKSE